MELYGGVHGGRGEREAGRVQVREGTSSASTSGGRSGARTCIARGSEQGTRQQWWARSVHGGHALDTRRPLGRFIEHVAGSKVISVGHDSGPFVGQIWTWAQKQSCSPHNALQFLFKVHCHKGYGLAINCAPK